MVVSVADTGSGMPDHVLARAFDPFFTTKGPGKGSGLGLSMVHGFAKQVGGTATIESVLANGTTVRLYLQRAISQPAVRWQVASAELPQPVRSLRILVVDDDDSVRNLTKEMLQEMGHDVADVASGRVALEHLKAGRACDLFLVDFAMPVMNGSECAADSRILRPDLSILSYADSDALRSWSTRGFPTLSKPFQYANSWRKPCTKRARQATSSHCARSDGA